MATIEDHNVLVAKNSYVNRKMLRNPHMQSVVLEKLAYLLRDPNAAIFRQSFDLHRFKRIRLMSSWRLYVRIYETEKVLAVVALDTMGNVKWSEVGDAVDPTFARTLQQYVDYNPAGLEPLPDLDEKPVAARPAPLPVEPTVFHYRPQYQIDTDNIDEQQAVAILHGLTQRGERTKLDLLADKVRNAHEDRLLIDPVSEGLVESSDDAREFRGALAAHFRKIGLPYAVRYDDLSQKLVVIAEGKLGFYWDGRCSGRVASRSCNDMY